MSEYTQTYLPTLFTIMAGDKPLNEEQIIEGLKQRGEYRNHLAAIAEMTGNGDDIGAAHEGVNALIEERDALAAHVELLSDNLQASINGIEWYRHNTSVDWGEADDEHLKYCEEAIKQKPATSLARRDAINQEKAVKDFAREVWEALIESYRTQKVLPLTMAKHWIERNKPEGHQ